MSVNISVKILVLYGKCGRHISLINRALYVVSTGVNNLLVIVDYSVKNLISISVKRCSIICCWTMGKKRQECQLGKEYELIGCKITDWSDIC